MNLLLSDAPFVMPSSKRSYIVPVVCIVLFAALGLAVCGRGSPVFFLFWQHPGYFDRVYFEGIVAQVRKEKLPSKEAACFRLAKPLDATSLQPCSTNESGARGQGAGMIFASQSPEGHLNVVFETKDLGHAGEYGFAYSDIPLEPQPCGGGWFTLDVPSHLNLVQPDMKIDEHWWRVVYNLD